MQFLSRKLLPAVWEFFFFGNGNLDLLLAKQVFVFAIVDAN